jgi:hypothetical protein
LQKLISRANRKGSAWITRSHNDHLLSLGKFQWNQPVNLDFERVPKFSEGENMKRVWIVLATILMLGVAAFAPYAPTSSEKTTLSAPTLISPANGATVHPGPLTWSWNRVPGAVRYHLQAGGGTAFDGQYNIIERWSLTEPLYMFNVTSGFVFYFHKLYWRVQAIDANGVAGPWSEVRVINLVSP